MGQGQIFYKTFNYFNIFKNYNEDGILKGLQLFVHCSVLLVLESVFSLPDEWVKAFKNLAALAGLGN